MSLTLLPDEVLHIIGHQYLEPPDIVALGSTCSRLHEVFLTNPFDIDIVKSLYGIKYCIKKGWWIAATLALKWDAVDSDTLVQVLSKLKIYDIENCKSLVKKLLADPRVDPACDTNLPIWRASCRGFTELVAILLEDSRVDPAVERLFPRPGVPLTRQYQRWPTPICGAAWYGHAETVPLLLSDPRVDPTMRNGVLLQNALVTHDNFSVVNVLLSDPRINISMLSSGYLIDMLVRKRLFPSLRRGRGSIADLWSESRRLKSLLRKRRLFLNSIKTYFETSSTSDKL